MGITRYRETGSTSRPTVNNTFVTCAGIVTSVPYNGHRIGEVSSMIDVVTPGFRKMSSQGLVINNPMTKTTQTFTGGGTGAAIVLDTCPNPTSTVYKTQAFDTSMRHYTYGFEYNELRDGAGQLTSPAILHVDVERLIALANTTACGNVSSSTASGLLMLGEAGKTLSMLRNPLQATLKYLKGNPMPRNAAGIKNSAKGLGNAASSQYLTWYYGLLPFIKDIEDVMKALSTPSDPERLTARGHAVDSKLTIGSSVEVGGCTKYIYHTERLEKVEIRAGTLYEPNADIGRVWGVRLSDIPETALELLPWSFVADWFLNLSDMVKALTPRVGIRYLAGWNTLISEITESTITDSSRMTCTGTSQTRGGTEWTRRTTKTVYRYPTEPCGNIGFALKPLSFPTTKTIAALSLITQQLTKRK